MADQGGSKLAARLMSRSGGGIHRRGMEDGGEVYSGPVATRALRAVGARAMTLDQTIIVDEGFNASNPEDQALYAHERLHQMESGGDDHPSDLHDAEEVAARTVERMVLHRAKAGESFGSIMRDVRMGAQDAPALGAGAGLPKGADPKLDEAAAAYAALLASGKDHKAIVRMLSSFVVYKLLDDADDTSFRSSPTNAF